MLSLPVSARQAIDRCPSHLSVWSIGSSSGEVLYTIALIWMIAVTITVPKRVCGHRDDRFLPKCDPTVMLVIGIHETLPVDGKGL